MWWSITPFEKARTPTMKSFHFNFITSEDSEFAIKRAVNLKQAQFKKRRSNFCVVRGIETRAFTKELLFLLYFIQSTKTKEIKYSYSFFVSQIKYRQNKNKYFLLLFRPNENIGFFFLISVHIIRDKTKKTNFCFVHIEQTNQENKFLT